MLALALLLVEFVCLANCEFLPRVSQSSLYPVLEKHWDGDGGAFLIAFSTTALEGRLETELIELRALTQGKGIDVIYGDCSGEHAGAQEGAAHGSDFEDIDAANLCAKAVVNEAPVIVFWSELLGVVPMSLPLSLNNLLLFVDIMTDHGTPLKLSTPQEAIEAIDDQDPAFIAFVQNQDELRVFARAVVRLSTSPPRTRFTYSTHPVIQSALGLSGTPSIVAFRNHGMATVTYGAARPWEATEINKWVTGEMGPTVLSLAEVGLVSLTQSRFPTLALLVDNSIASAKKVMQDVFHVVGTKYHIAVGQGPAAQEVAAQLGLTGIPAVVLMYPATALNYARLIKDEADSLSVLRFVREVEAGTVGAVRRSTPVDENTSGLLPVSAATLPSTVLGYKGSVALLLRLDGCRPCDVAEAVLQNIRDATPLPDTLKDTRFAVMDLSVNEIDPRYEIHNLPTVLIFPRGEKSQDTVPDKMESDLLDRSSLMTALETFLHASMPDNLSSSQSLLAGLTASQITLLHQQRSSLRDALEQARARDEYTESPESRSRWDRDEL